MESKVFIESGFKRIFGSTGFDEDFIREIFDQSYIQHVDGKTLELEEFIKHIKVLKERTKSIKVDFKTLIEEGDTVFSNHVVTATMKDHTKTIIHVIAEFRVRNGKMYYCDELTSLIDGNPNNSNLGSAH
ncbi:nuclear transport factor 2 family protein [Abyssalbus ytuae]|uniref:Nuclear transport factor 2 family protein n=1 Tax=Abyssalbus ytuae TaxID=2926907 RepID=A0A9E6ZP68_9FLAO|nr:nuclear transport factor 2 family protein [Abyssalbus ytuae]UOB17960.1 nuclear transport factor 2 family protein [Abyssalbus ytuae]